MTEFFFVYEYAPGKVTQTFYHSKESNPEVAFKNYIKTLSPGEYKLLNSVVVVDHCSGNE